MKIKKELIKREIAGEVMLVPVGKTVLDFNGLFAMNSVGGFIWDAIPEAESEAELVAAVLREYEVDEATAKADVAEFVQKLREMGILD